MHGLKMVKRWYLTAPLISEGTPNLPESHNSLCTSDNSSSYSICVPSNTTICKVLPASKGLMRILQFKPSKTRSPSLQQYGQKIPCLGADPSFLFLSNRRSGVPYSIRHPSLVVDMSSR